MLKRVRIERVRRLARAVRLGAVVLVLAGCQTPFLVFPGGALKGSETVTESFAFARDARLLVLEVRPDDPYSVILRAVVIEDQLYIDAGKRRWHEYMVDNPDVRIEISGSVYPARAVATDDPAIVERFRSGRTVYRMEPR